jgi:hypothetical protein
MIGLCHRDRENPLGIWQIYRSLETKIYRFASRLTRARVVIVNNICFFIAINKIRFRDVHPFSFSDSNQFISILYSGSRKWVDLECENKRTIWFTHGTAIIDLNSSGLFDLSFVISLICINSGKIVHLEARRRMDPPRRRWSFDWAGPWNRWWIESVRRRMPRCHDATMPRCHDAHGCGLVYT